MRGIISARDPPCPLFYHSLPCRADVRVTGITSGAGLPSGSRVFDAITVKRRGALRPAPALSNAVESCPVDVVVWNPGPERAKAIADLGDDDWRHYV